MSQQQSSPASYANAAVVALGLLFGACAAEEHAGEVPAARASPAGDPGAPVEQPDTGRVDPAAPGARYDETGIASWYGPRHHGRRTASGTAFDMHALTAAHRILPLGTVVSVENLANGRSIELRITDRGPYVERRIIDLSMAAAQRLDLRDRGVGLVGLTILPAAVADAAAIAP